MKKGSDALEFRVRVGGASVGERFWHSVFTELLEPDALLEGFVGCVV